MAEPKLEPIVKRIRHLSSLVSTSGLDGSKGSGFVTPQLVGHEGLLDALFVLYDECNNDQMKKDANVCAFIDKCEFFVVKFFIGLSWKHSKEEFVFNFWNMSFFIIIIL